MYVYLVFYPMSAVIGCCDPEMDKWKKNWMGRWTLCNVACYKVIIFLIYLFSFAFMGHACAAQVKYSLYSSVLHTQFTLNQDHKKIKIRGWFLHSGKIHSAVVVTYAS